MAEPLTQERYDARRVELHIALQAAEAGHAAAALRAETGEGSSDDLTAARHAVDEVKHRQLGLDAARKLSAEEEAQARAEEHLKARAAAAVELRNLHGTTLEQAAIVAGCFADFAKAYGELIEMENGLWPIARPFVLDGHEAQGALATAFNSRSEPTFIAGLLHRAGFERMDDINWVSARRFIDEDTNGAGFAEYIEQGLARAMQLTTRYIPELRNIRPADDED